MTDWGRVMIELLFRHLGEGRRQKRKPIKLKFRGGASRPALDITKIFKGRFAARQMMWQNARENENQRSDMFAK